MKVLAIVEFGQVKIDDNWECSQGGSGERFLIVLKYHGGKLLCLKLDPNRLKQVSGKYVYSEPLNILNAVIISN